MKSLKALKLTYFISLVFLAANVGVVFAQNNEVLDEMTKQLEEKSQEVKYLEGEISFTQLRYKSSKEKLVSYEREINEKYTQLKILQKRYADNPTTENEQKLRNEEQRIELAELSMKSRVASVARLESKELELKQQLAARKSEIVQLQEDAVQAKLAHKVEQKTQVIKNELEEQKDTLARRLLTLQRENERLRQVALDEVQKRELAEARAVLAEQRFNVAQQLLAAVQHNTGDLAVEESAGVNAKDVAIGEMERIRKLLLDDSVSSIQDGLSLYLKGEDGANIGMFRYLGAQQYRKDVVLDSAESSYRVGGRIYKIRIGEADVGQEFVFLYDLSDSDKPRFVTFQKSLIDSSGEIAAQ